MKRTILLAIFCSFVLWFNVLSYRNEKLKEEHIILEERQSENEDGYLHFVIKYQKMQKENKRLRQQEHIYSNHIRRSSVYEKKLRKLIKERNIKYKLFPNLIK